MRYASIDIGTNTILMLIGEIDENLIITPLGDFYEVPRLGKNVSVTKELAASSIDRAIDVLRNYKAIADEYEVEKIVASATSAVRDAINKDDFVRRVEQETGIVVEIIGGETEADVGFIGAVSGSPHPEEPTLVIDIGGGSTELSYGAGSKPGIAKSIDVGAVRITERFLLHDPPALPELTEASEFVKDGLACFPFDEMNPRTIYAVAGTATTLALIAQNKYEFDAEAVSNYEMTVGQLREVFDEIKKRPSSEIIRLTKAAEGRADVLVAGTLVLIEILSALKAERFLTTDRGLRYGYLIYKHRQFLTR